MSQRIDKDILRDLTTHTRQLGLVRVFRSMAYERCIELPLLVSHLRSHYERPLRYLDIGSGDSILPSYLLARSKWHMTLVDKFSTLQAQTGYANRSMKGRSWEDRFSVINDDFLTWNSQEATFDIITCISVIEHFSGSTDTVAIQKMSQLLAPGGILMIVTPVNGDHPQDFFQKNEVYGEKFEGEPVFFQRHYDVQTLKDRLIVPSGLREEERVYYGDYGFQYKETFTNVPWPWKPIRVFYQWATPLFARMFARYSDQPVSRKHMHMYTASGVFLALRK